MMKGAQTKCLTLRCCAMNAIMELATTVAADVTLVMMKSQNQMEVLTRLTVQGWVIVRICAVAVQAFMDRMVA